MTLSLDECLERISALPQASFIDPAVAARWVRRTMEVDPTRIGWHILRAGGVGGSESGALVDWRFGGCASRTDATRLARSKLLLLPPERGNDDMARGSHIETYVQDTFERKLDREGRNWSRRDDIKARLDGGHHPEHPWLRASTDAVYEIDGSIVIVDFKAPSEEALEQYSRHGGFDDYRVQLNHYHLVAAGKGIRVDGLMLAMFDYRRVATVGCRVFDIDVDRDLQDRIVSSSSEFWNGHVMRGDVPRTEPVRILDGASIPDPDIQSVARRAIVAKMTLDAAEKAFEDARERIAASVGKAGLLGDGVLPMGRFDDDQGGDGFLQVTAKRALDTDRIVGRLVQLGMDPEHVQSMRLPGRMDPAQIESHYANLRRASAALLDASASGDGMEKARAAVAKALSRAPKVQQGRWDEEALLSALVTCNESPYPFYIEEVTSNLPRSRSLSELNHRRNMVSRSLDEFFDGLSNPSDGDVPRRSGFAM